MRENWIDHRLDHQLAYRWLTFTLKSPGTWWFAAICAALVSICHPWKLRGGGFIVLCVAASFVSAILKWLVGRYRPYTTPESDAWGRPLEIAFEPLRGGLAGIADQANLSFVSGHACTAFALATALAMMMPRGRWIFFAVATITGLERVAENAHWLSDTYAAAVIGVGVTHGVRWICDRVMK
jgi:membrane-associated phospholipid phosphatase